MQSSIANTKPSTPFTTVFFLDSSAWREFRGTPSSAGQNPTTHLAKVADPNGTLHDCFVKLLPPGPALLCEALGWTLAHAAGVQCPSFGAIVLVPLDELRKSVTLPATYDGASLWPAWCCELVEGKSLRQIHKIPFYFAKKSLFRSRDARKIAAFDKWTDLRDRNFGNVIRSPKGGFVAIDHETLLHDLLWVPSGTTWSERCLTAEASKALSNAEFKRFQVDMANAANDHGQALANAQANLDAIVTKMVPTPADATLLSQSISSALGQRSKPGWLAGQLKVIA